LIRFGLDKKDGGVCSQSVYDLVVMDEAFADYFGG